MKNYNFMIQHEGKHSGKPSLFINLNTVTDIKYFIKDKLKTPYNMDSKFLHPITFEEINLVFSGINSFTAENQLKIIEAIELLSNENNTPKYITIETDGKQVPCQAFIEYFNGKVIDWSDGIKKRIDLTWSVVVEHANDINFDNLFELNSLNENGQVLFMCDGTDWDGIAAVAKKIKQDLMWDLWIVPLTAKVYNEATMRGYRVSVDDGSVM